MDKRFVVISGCSGGGKSTLLNELQARGYPVIAEPGRRIVSEQQASGGDALPWVNPISFLQRTIELALKDWDAAQAHYGWVFFDRGLVDSASALEALSEEPMLDAFSVRHRYYHCVFMAPPWPEIYVTDAERRHDLDAAISEYERLMETYPKLGYEVIALPKASISARADFVLATGISLKSR